MRRIARRFSSPVVTALVVALVVGGATAAAAPTAVTSVVKFAKRATFAKKAARATRAKFASRAGKANRATLAVSAKVANNSTLLGGHPASDFARGPANQKIDFRAQAGTGETTLLDTGKLLLSASCDGTGKLRILASTKIDHADIEGLGNGGDIQDDDFNIAESPVSLGPTQGETRRVIYTEPGGQTVELNYLASASNYPPPGAGDPNPDHGKPLGGSVACLVTGFAIVQ
jgi:type II secretory pathway pseudopilin PulG